MYNLIESVRQFNDEHKLIIWDLFRFFLGSLLVLKGFHFSLHMSVLFEKLMADFPYSYFILAHYVVIAHIAGGLCLAFGLQTRVMALINIPVIIGAMVFIHGIGLSAGFMPTQGFEYSSLTLFSLMAIFWYGPGEYSVDQLIEAEESREYVKSHVVCVEDREIREIIQRKAC